MTHDIADDQDDDREDFFDIDDIDDIEKRPSFLTSPPGPSSSYPGLIFCAMMCIFSLLYWHSSYDQYLGVSYHTMFIEHEYWRLVTSLFVHADLTHLLANMPLFFIFSWLLHHYYGVIAFPVCALLSGIFTQLIVLPYYNPHTILLGASGMLYGMMSLWLVWYIRYEHTRSAKSKWLRVIGFLLIMLVPSTFSPKVSHLAHGVGFVLGALEWIVLFPFMSKRIEKKWGQVDSNTSQDDHHRV